MLGWRTPMIDDYLHSLAASRSAASFAPALGGFVMGQE